MRLLTIGFSSLLITIGFVRSAEIEAHSDLLRRTISGETGSLVVSEPQGVRFTESVEPLPAIRLKWRRKGSETDTLLMVPRAFAVDAQRIVVFDGGDALVTVLDGKTGRVLRRFGRRGAGPGELRDVVRLEIVGQNIVAVDRANGKLTSFDLNGRLVSEVSAPVASVGASCSITPEVLALASLGTDDITFVNLRGEVGAAIHRLVPKDDVTEPLLRLPLLLRSRRSGVCIAVRPYGGKLIEFSQDTVFVVKSLYRENRPVRIERRGSRKQGTAVKVIKGSPTVEDVCSAGDLMFALRSSSKSAKVLDVFHQGSWRYLGSVPIDASTIMIACSGDQLVAKEYSDGLLGFASYSIGR